MLAPLEKIILDILGILGELDEKTKKKESCIVPKRPFASLQSQKMFIFSRC
jgi:hypothetical protein